MDTGVTAAGGFRGTGVCWAQEAMDSSVAESRRRKTRIKGARAIMAGGDKARQAEETPGAADAAVYQPFRRAGISTGVALPTICIEM